MSTDPFAININEGFIGIEPPSDSVLDRRQPNVDALTKDEETKEEKQNKLETTTAAGSDVAQVGTLGQQVSSLLSKAEQGLESDSGRTFSDDDLKTAVNRDVFMGGRTISDSDSKAGQFYDNVNNTNQNDYITNIFGGTKSALTDAFDSINQSRQELKKSGMAPVVAGVFGGPMAAAISFAPLVADGFQQKKDMNKFLNEFGDKGFSDDLLNKTFSYGKIKSAKTGKQFLEHVLVNDFNPGYALKYNAYGGKDFDGNHHDALEKFIVDGVDNNVFSQEGILKLASQRHAFKAGSDNYWKSTVAQRALKKLGFTIKGRTAVDSSGNTYLDGRLWKTAEAVNKPAVVSAGTSSNQGTADTGGGEQPSGTGTGTIKIGGDIITKDQDYYENFNKPGGGFSLGFGLKDGGERVDGDIGNLEFINERGKDMSGVADDIQRPLEEGDFVLNKPAVDFAGKKDVDDMIEEAKAIAMARGIALSPERDGNLETMLSNGEVVIPKVLAEIIGYDKLNKINNRGKEKVKEIVQARKEQIPEKPVVDDPRLRAQLGGAVGSVLDSDVATGKLAAAGAPGEILSTPRGAFVNIAKPMPTAQVLQQTPIGEEILRPQTMMNEGGEREEEKIIPKKKPKITQFELVRNSLSSTPYKLRNEAIAGILGNIAVETGETFDYRTSQMGGPGRGLFQFEGGHSRAYEDYKKANNLSPSIGAQVSYVLDNIYKGTGFDIGIKNRKDLQNIFATGTTSEIAKSFAEIFERPNPEKAKYEKRIQRANEIYDMLYRPNPQKSFPLTMSKEDALKEIDETKPVIGTGLLN
jgi:hypothetical protein